jgi:hypothetical protein
VRRASPVRRWTYYRQSGRNSPCSLSGGEDLRRATAPQGQREAEFGQPTAMYSRGSLEVDAAEARLIIGKFGQPGPYLPRGCRDVAPRHVQTRPDVAGVQPARDRIAPIRRTDGIGDRDGRVHLARGEVGLHGDQTGGPRGQPKAVAGQLVTKPQRRLDEPRPRAPGGKVTLQQDELSAAPPRVVTATAEPISGPSRESARLRHIARDQCTASPIQLSLAKVLGEPLTPEDDGRLGEHFIGLPSQPRLGQYPRPTKQGDPRRHRGIQPKSLSHQPQRTRKITDQELDVAQVVHGLELEQRQVRRRGDVGALRQSCPRRCHRASIEIHRTTVEQHPAALDDRRLGKEGLCLVELAQRTV